MYIKYSKSAQETKRGHSDKHILGDRGSGGFCRVQARVLYVARALHRDETVVASWFA